MAVNDRFIQHEMDDGQIDISLFIRLGASSLCDEIEHRLNDSREKSLALTKLEECVMWANKAIAIHGVKE